MTYTHPIQNAVERGLARLFSGDTVVWLKSAQPSIVVTAELIEVPEGIAVVNVQENPVELLFDGKQWEVRASPR